MFRLSCASVSVRFALGISLCAATWALPAVSQPVEFLTPKEAEGPLASRRTSELIRGIQLSEPTGTSVGFEGHGGMALLRMDGKAIAHGIYGGTLRLRTHYLSFGAIGDASDYAYEEYRQLGGFAGARLPYTNWVDVEATAGFAYRQYRSHDRKFGASGTRVNIPALMLRLGITDRVGESLVGARMGAELFAQVDLGTKSVYWEYRIQDVVYSSGNATFGGVTLGMQMNLGFDFYFPKSTR